jgi:hypothetical protein
VLTLTVTATEEDAPVKFAEPGEAEQVAFAGAPEQLIATVPANPASAKLRS